MLFGEFIVRSQENLILIEMWLFLQCYFLFWQMLWNVNACALHRAWGMLKLMLATVYTQLRLSIWDVNFDKKVLLWKSTLNYFKMDNFTELQMQVYFSATLQKARRLELGGKKGGEQKKRTM